MTDTPDFDRLKSFLDEKYFLYNNPQFIESDPISIPHRFKLKEDVEISGFLAATIAWGQRRTIITNALRLMHLMDNEPYRFIREASEHEFEKLNGFVHRTFNSDDCLFFIYSLRNIYRNYNGLQGVFENFFAETGNIKSSIAGFRSVFMETPHLSRNLKHLANVDANSSAKRINMFLRWMVRKDDKGVDFGLWTGIPQSALYIPLDLHTGNTARKLGLLSRKQNDWKAVEELTSVLRKFDPTDPVKYDFALFGLGVFEKY